MRNRCEAKTAFGDTDENSGTDSDNDSDFVALSTIERVSSSRFKFVYSMNDTGATY